MYCATILSFLHCSNGKSNRGKVVELYAQNVTNNLMDWENDMAIVFYAPWCTYCKQLLPSWEVIAQESAKNRNLLISKFNCERPVENADFCRELGVDKYPSIFFIGYGDFKQNSKKSGHSSVVRFVADLYPEAIYDWVRMLTFFSSLHRKWDYVINLFTGNSRLEKKMSDLQERLLLSERKVRVFGKELEKYKALEVFDSLEDEGDVFPLLNQLEPDEVRMFISILINLM